jgi:hypothetical protein
MRIAQKFVAELKRNLIDVRRRRVRSITFVCREKDAVNFVEQIGSVVTSASATLAAHL